MRILFLGDIMGRSGREAVAKYVPTLRRSRNLDIVIANGENATHGNGITLAHAQALLAAGVDCLTLGDHAFDHREMAADITKETRIIRPLNFASLAPGMGTILLSDARGRKVLVINALGRVFMKPTFADPFPLVKKALQTYRLGGGVAAIIVDFHAEASSEKNAMGRYCDGAATLVAGTHTHIPTADQRILSGGTAYITDAGMCGNYDSIIGMDPVEPMRRFVTGMSKERFSPSKGRGTLSGVIVESDDGSGLAKSIELICEGEPLSRIKN